MKKITIREGWVDNLNDIDLEILMGELNFPKIYAKERVKGEGHHASPSWVRLLDCLKFRMRSPIFICPARMV